MYVCIVKKKGIVKEKKRKGKEKKLAKHARPG